MTKIPSHVIPGSRYLGGMDPMTEGMDSPCVGQDATVLHLHSHTRHMSF